ncbi:MAG TPA: BTAD domain-containing putative transcriptional regulator [Stellaceae bacterium]|jgi:DNA-binding SARP family transcriptional activator/TolB-like protein|nr:BTAD domain-containing putative transcriptional regulator [Stellaceae bacterium]
MALLIGLLGPLVIEGEDRQFGKVPRKARALLAYMAAQGGRAVSRERLSDLLWPYQGSDQARHSLRNCLLELRKALAPAAGRHLATEFANCRLQAIDVDIEHFERLARSPSRAELLAAAELYRGEFLADFVIDSEPFQEWLAAERDRTLDLICSVLQRLTALQDEAGEHDAAIQSARRLAALDPLSEIGQRALIRAYAHAGRRPEALRQYRTCAEILKRELGVAPDAETQALANEIARSGAIGDGALAGRAAEMPYRDTPAMPTPLDRVAVKPAIPRHLAPLERRAGAQWPCVLPSIAVAVAPLRNLTGDPEQQYLVEAFSDDLVTDLLRHGRGLALARIADERRPPDLLARPGDAETEYVVTGSAQRSGPATLRVNMQITKAATGEYCWADRYEFDPDDLVPTQTEITRRISRELHLLVLQRASRRAAITSGDEFGVNECLSRATNALKGRITPELTAEAQSWLLSALASDPRNVEALTGLAFTCQHVVSQPWWGNPQAVAMASDLGREVVGLALSLAPGHAIAHCIQGMLRSAAGQLAEADDAFERALAADRRLGIAHAFAGYNAVFRGHAEETMPAVERAMRLDQTDRRCSTWFFFGGFAELLLGRTEASIALLRKSLERNPIYGSAQLFLTAALSMSGRASEAARVAASFREHYPEYRLNSFEQLWLSRSTSPAYRAQIGPVFESIRGLGAAG